MATKLYVGGLPYQTDDKRLLEVFSQAGKVVSAQVIMDRETGRSKGFGFVEYDSNEEAQNAISMFDQQELDGRTIRVNEARPLQDKPRRNDRFNQSNGQGNRRNNW